MTRKPLHGIISYNLHERGKLENGGKNTFKRLDYEENKSNEIAKRKIIKSAYLYVLRLICAGQ
jgi:hypothetical protein